MIKPSTSIADQAQSLRSLNPSKSTGSFKDDSNVITKVYAITSGKGGVGKTVITANTAVSLAKLGKSVLIFDADLGLANIDVLFGLAPQFNLNHFFSGEKELADILIGGPLGIKILPSGTGIQDFTRLDSHLKSKLFDGFRSLEMVFDFILIDTETGISDNVTHFTSAAEEILVVTTPDPIAITDAYALMKLLSTDYQKKHFNLVINRINGEDEARDVHRKLTIVSDKHLDISIDYIGFIPEDTQMIESIKKKRVVVELHPSSNISRGFTRLATYLCSEKKPDEPNVNFQFFWKKFFSFGGQR